LHAKGEKELKNKGSGRLFGGSVGTLQTRIVQIKLQCIASVGRDRIFQKKTIERLALSRIPL
jgi:hypothetical protein